MFFEDGYVERISVYSIISAAILFSYFCSFSLRKTQRFCPLLYAIRNLFKLKNIHKYEVYTYLYHFRKFHDEKKDIRYFTTHTNKYMYAHATESYHNRKQQLTIQRPSMTSRCSLWSRISCFHRFLVAVLKKSGNTTCPLGHTFE